MLDIVFIELPVTNVKQSIYGDKFAVKTKTSVPSYNPVTASGEKLSIWRIASKQL